MNCAYCPFSFVLSYNNSATMMNQTCISCGLGCIRCLPTSASTCTSCASGYYLQSGACTSCGVGCENCLGPNTCDTCRDGYVPIAPAITLGNGVTGPVLYPFICAACVTPCATCVGSVYTCITCVTNFYSSGANCISNFNVRASAVLSSATTPANFNDQLSSFLQSIANSAGVSINAITILSINYGSITIDFVVSTSAEPGSTAAVNLQNSVTNTLSSGSVGGLSVTSSSVSNSVGSSTNNGESGLSRTTIIILATVIPIGTLCTFFII